MKVERSPRKPSLLEFRRTARTRLAGLPSNLPERLVVMKLKIKTPPELWYSEFTRRHAELVVEATSISTLPGTDTLGEYEIYGPPVDWTKQIASAPNVVEVECLATQPVFGRYRIRYQQSPLIALANELEVLVRYPRTIQRGILECEIVAWPSQLRSLLRALEKAGNEPQLVSLRRDSLRSVRLSLTPIQRALFREALAWGYFEVPRRITLTRLASRVSRSNSSVSRTLAVVERKLAQSANLLVS
jgi:predicted DNA binding protein